ncbi:hypothetical protein MPTK1_7g07140 [Marchantia polymorpha subsp. ruderalis]
MPKAITIALGKWISNIQLHPLVDWKKSKEAGMPTPMHARLSTWVDTLPNGDEREKNFVRYTSARRVLDQGASQKMDRPLGISHSLSLSVCFFYRRRYSTNIQLATQPQRSKAQPKARMLGRIQRADRSYENENGNANANADGCRDS